MCVSISKIIIAIHSIQVGGMERVASELANNFICKENCEVHIILYGIKRDIFYTLDPNIIIHKPSFPFDNNNRAESTIKTLIFLRKKIKQLQPDAVLSFGELWNNLILLSTLGMQTPIFIADRSTPLKNLGTVQNTLRKFLYPKAEVLIVQTEKAKKIYKQQFSRLNIEVIGNPISKTTFQKNIRRENIILMVGRLIDTKHHERLIQIFSKLQPIDWKLVLVGGDANKQQNKKKLEELVDRLNLNEKVFLVGNQKDVASYYAKSKIFAFTSSSEGFPNVLGEAMTAGLPVIAYDCMVGPSEIIKDGQNGFLIPLFDDEIFLLKLDLLIKNDMLRKEMGNRAKNYIDKYDIDIISQRYLNVLFSK